MDIKSYLFILILLIYMINNLYFVKFTVEHFNNKAKILFLMRSYNRPEYLQKTLNSLNSSDIDICSNRLIYDDASTDKQTLEILKNAINNNYEVLFNKKNLRQYSMVNFLKIIENKNLDYEYICYVDNDVEVKKDFFQKCLTIFKLIQREQNLPSNKIILTGFNTKEHKVINSYKQYHEKDSIGAVHLFFHKSLLNSIYNWWTFRNSNGLSEDWGIVTQFKKNNGRIFCTKPSIIQHIGEIGYNSNPNSNIFDVAEDFN